MTLGGAPRSRRGPSGAVEVWSFIPMSALKNPAAPTMRELEGAATLTFRRVTFEAESGWVFSTPMLRTDPQVCVWENEGGAL